MEYDKEILNFLLDKFGKSRIFLNLNAAKQAKKDEIGTFEHDEILFVVQAELDFNESGEE